MSFRSKNNGRALLPFGLDFSDVLSTTSGIDKPEFVLPVNGPLTDSEVNAAKQSISLSKLMIDGPFYTGSNHSGDKEMSSTAADGIQRHSDKYKKIKKIGRTIEEHPYQIEFFPEELYSVMGISNKRKKKLLSLSSYKSDGGLREFNPNVDPNEDQANSMLEKLKKIAEDLDSGEQNNGNKEDEEEIELEMDDEFDEEEDDDYNAEKYFDDGDDDMADNGDDEAAF